MAKTIVLHHIQDHTANVRWVSMTEEESALFVEMAKSQEITIQWREIYREAPTTTPFYYLDNEGKRIPSPGTRADPAEETP